MPNRVASDVAIPKSPLHPVPDRPTIGLRQVEDRSPNCQERSGTSFDRVRVPLATRGWLHDNGLQPETALREKVEWRDRRPASLLAAPWHRNRELPRQRPTPSAPWGMTDRQ